MATLTVQLVSGLGTNSATLTYSAADASRIFTAWQNVSKTGGTTQADFATWLANQVQTQLAGFVIKNESTQGTAPTITVS